MFFFFRYRWNCSSSVESDFSIWCLGTKPLSITESILTNKYCQNYFDGIYIKKLNLDLTNLYTTKSLVLGTTCFTPEIVKYMKKKLDIQPNLGIGNTFNKFCQSLYSKYFCFCLAQIPWKILITNLW